MNGLQLGGGATRPPVSFIGSADLQGVLKSNLTKVEVSQNNHYFFKNVTIYILYCVSFKCILMTDLFEIWIRICLFTTLEYYRVDHNYK